ncbi:RNase H domain-containing protein [Trichonephila clavipes]|nr:RNase H domain-containing protein [Trichonephila clavipes]
MPTFYPFPKPGEDPTSANNYRPIALTSCLSKLMERIVFFLTNLSDSIGDLKIRSVKTLNILKVLANTRWGADGTSLLRFYRALIRSKLDYGSVVYSSACKSLLKILDPVHHQALRLCLGAFRTSPVESLYAEAYEPPLDLRRKYLSTIYTAELHALRIALEHISLSCGKQFIIYTDSLSALQSIVSLHSSSHPILVDIKYALANHLKKKDIRFCWIPGHAGITGNELADTAARSATGSSERFPIRHSDLKACFRQKLQSVWQSNWDQQTENKLHSVMPVLAPTVLSSRNRREQVIWTRLRLGHTCLTYRHLLLGEPPPYCEKCNVSLSNESRTSEMLAAACAVGVACSFAAPIGG